MNHRTPPLPTLLCCMLVGPAATLPAQRPNVVLIVTDDQGYGDLGTHGNTMIRTPNLDRLASESVRLRDYHVDPTCSPTRSARAGTYEITLWRWPSELAQAMGCVEARLRIAGVEEQRAVDPAATCARFRVRLASGPTMLWTTLKRAGGTEHGAYFADVRLVD